jgi:hypothetical protein
VLFSYLQPVPQGRSPKGVTRRHKRVNQCRVTGFALRPDTTWNTHVVTTFPGFSNCFDFLYILLFYDKISLFIQIALAC